MTQQKFYNPLKQSLTAAGALALVLCLAMAAGAQSQDSQEYKKQMQQQQQQEAPDISDARIEKTAEAYTAVTEIREEHRDEFSQAKSSEEAQALQSKINEKITGAIEQHDMTVEEYNQVITAAQTDEDLRSELLDQIREMRE